MGNPVPRDQRLSKENLVATRRARVATLANRLLTKREIYEALANPDTPFFTVNPGTREPYSESTIYNDMVYNKKKAIERANQASDEHLAMLLAECREARKVAWGRVSWDKGALTHIHKFIDLEAKLLGLYQPDMMFTQNNQQNNFFMGPDGQPLTVDEMSDEELMKMAGQPLEIIEGQLVDESTD